MKNERIPEHKLNVTLTAGEAVESMMSSREEKAKKSSRKQGK